MVHPNPAKSLGENFVWGRFVIFILHFAAGWMFADTAEKLPAGSSLPRRSGETGRVAAGGSVKSSILLPVFCCFH